MTTIKNQESFFKWFQNIGGNVCNIDFEKIQMKNEPKQNPERSRKDLKTFNYVFNFKNY